MTNNWFEVRVKYVEIDDNGKEKKVNKPYLVDAVSVTEAEARAIKELEAVIHSDLIVKSAKTSNISEIFPSENGDRWFKAKTTFVTVDEESGKEKRVNNYMLVEANNVKDAYEHLCDGLSDMIVPFEIPSVSESPIVDVFPFFKDEVNEEIPENLKPLKEVESQSSKEFNMLVQAADLIIDSQNASTSLLQRRFSLTYKDAGFIMDKLEERGIIGPFTGSKPREVLIPRVHEKDITSMLM